MHVHDWCTAICGLFIGSNCCILEAFNRTCYCAHALIQSSSHNGSQRSPMSDGLAFDYGFESSLVLLFKLYLATLLFGLLFCAKL